MIADQENSVELLEIDPVLQRALGILQDQMALIDLIRKPTESSGLELVLKRHLLLAIRIDGNLTHERAHIHLDYHRTKHMASYAIDTGELLAGDSSYSSAVQPWIAKHRRNLMRVWKGIRGAGVDPKIVAQLRGSAFCS